MKHLDRKITKLGPNEGAYCESRAKGTVYPISATTCVACIKNYLKENNMEIVNYPDVQDRINQVEKRREKRLFKNQLKNILDK